MPPSPDHHPSLPASIGAAVLRAVLYTLAIVILVLYAPTANHTFIYQGF